MIARDTEIIMIMRKIGINFEEVLDLVKQKEIRKTINKTNILNNWKIAKQEKQKDLLSIYFVEELKDEEIYDRLNKLNFNDIKK